jgi:hypothetical protein
VITSALVFSLGAVWVNGSRQIETKRAQVLSCAGSPTLFERQTIGVIVGYQLDLHALVGRAGSPYAFILGGISHDQSFL